VRTFAIVLFILSIFIAYSAPIFYEAYVEHTVLKASRHIASDLIWARRLSIRTGKNYGVKFIKGENPGYFIFFENPSKVIKSVRLKDINSHVKFYNAFDDKGVALVDNTFTFIGQGRSEQQTVPGQDSIFLINDSDESRGLTDRVVRVYIDRDNNNIKLLRVTEKTDAGDYIFSAI